MKYYIINNYVLNINDFVYNLKIKNNILAIDMNVKTLLDNILINDVELYQNIDFTDKNYVLLNSNNTIDNNHIIDGDDLLNTKKELINNFCNKHLHNRINLAYENKKSNFLNIRTKFIEFFPEYINDGELVFLEILNNGDAFELGLIEDYIDDMMYYEKLRFEMFDNMAILLNDDIELCEFIKSLIDMAVASIYDYQSYKLNEILLEKAND